VTSGAGGQPAVLRDSFEQLYVFLIGEHGKPHAI
jgi:hypothetical protein